MMMKHKKNRGFTLAETLLVVAIVVILMGVAFVSVIQYRRSMRQLEYDGFAKEIFIAAQNHLTMANNQGLVGGRQTGTPCPVESGKEIYYFIAQDDDPSDEDSVLNLMLPFGAVDETARLGGSYVIRYQKSSGLVIDVFYSSTGDHTGLLANLGTTFSAGDYSNLVNNYRGEEKKAARRRFNGKVIGWYGGGDAAPVTKQLEAPVIQIINADKLTVKVTNPNREAKDSDGSLCERLQLYIVGKTSKAKRILTLSQNGTAGIGYSYDGSGKVISVDLDDITTDGKHFAQQFPEFLPGEDLEIWAESDSATALTSIASSAKLSTNSLFASIEKVSGDPCNTASVAYIRHLENLDSRVSGFSPFDLNDKTTQNKLYAKQTSDMSWTDFRSYTENRAIQFVGTGSTAIAADSYYPVDPTYSLESYDGQKHSVTGVVVNTDGDAGLFARLKSGCTVKDLELIEFDVKTTGEGKTAGALAGTAVKVSVTNVAAHNKRRDDNMKQISASGIAGGLIGSLSGGSTLTDCCAAVYVSASGSAGGLVGSSSGTKLTHSYSGGHTDKGVYQTSTSVGQVRWNVIGAAAGGLIGSSSGDTLSGCYSTCSASGTGTAAGGLIGSSSGSTATNCYVTGLVSKDGKAVVGAGSLGGSGNHYYSIVNQLPANNTGTEQLMEPGNVPGDTCSVTENITEYNNFYSGSAKALAYDPQLVAAYRGVYPLPASGAAAGSYAAAHYGDWPMPETRAINVIN